MTPKQNIGEPGELAMIPVEFLYVDEAYQRPILRRGEANIIQIVEHFDWKYFTPLTVRKHSETVYTVPDGQHRGVAAITHRGIKQVPCYIVPANSQAEEAEIFAISNARRTNVSALQIHVAGSVAGEKDAAQVKKVCDAAGAEICRYPVPSLQMKPGQTLAIATIRKSIAKYGEEVVILAIKTVTKTGNGNAGLLNEMSIGGAAMALSQRPKLFRPEMEARLFRAIKRETIREMIGNARRRRALEGGSAISLYAQEFNKMLADAQLIELEKESHGTRFKLS